MRRHPGRRKSGSSAAAWLLAALAAGALAGVPAGARPLDEPLPPTNRAILQLTLEGAARELVRATPIAPGTQIVVRASTERAVDQEALAAVLEALVEHGVEAWPVSGDLAAFDTVATAAAVDSATGLPGEPAASTQAPSRRAAKPKTASQEAGTASWTGPPPSVAVDALPLLELVVDEARVDYTRLHRAGVLGAQHVERRALGQLSARLLKPEVRSIYWIGSADSTYSDVVPRSEIKSLEDVDRPEVNGTVPVQSWTKAVEPILVGALVVGLVALFYTNRP